MSADGDASHAYRGYRLQALYTLDRALIDTSVTFQPEGKEDLAIYDATSQLSEIVQVKAYADPLTLSHLEPGKKDGFFARLAREMPLPANVSIRLASYGPCGPELRQAFGFNAPKQQAVAQKIHKANPAISQETAAHILERMLLEEVQETTLKERMFARLGQLCTGIDPEKAFDLMIAWLYRAAEAKLRVTQTELVEHIGTIGQFLSNTATYLREWGTRFRSTRGSLPSPPLQNRTCHFHGIRLLSLPIPWPGQFLKARNLERPPFTAPTLVSSHPLGEPPAS